MNYFFKDRVKYIAHNSTVIGLELENTVLEPDNGNSLGSTGAQRLLEKVGPELSVSCSLYFLRNSYATSAQPSLSFTGIICAIQSLHASTNQFQVLKILKLPPDCNTHWLL